MSESDEEVRITLRLPARLRDKINGEIRTSGRSMNAEIVKRLEDSFDETQALWDQSNHLEESVDELKRQFDTLQKKVSELWEVHLYGRS